MSHIPHEGFPQPPNQPDNPPLRVTWKPPQTPEAPRQQPWTPEASNLLPAEQSPGRDKVTPTASTNRETEESERRQHAEARAAVLRAFDSEQEHHAIQPPSPETGAQTVGVPQPEPAHKPRHPFKKAMGKVGDVVKGLRYRKAERSNEQIDTPEAGGNFGDMYRDASNKPGDTDYYTPPAPPASVKLSQHEEEKTHLTAEQYAKKSVDKKIALLQQRADKKIDRLKRRAKKVGTSAEEKSDAISNMATAKATHIRNGSDGKPQGRQDVAEGKAQLIQRIANEKVEHIEGVAQVRAGDFSRRIKKVADHYEKKQKQVDQQYEAGQKQEKKERIAAIDYTESDILHAIKAHIPAAPESESNPESGPKGYVAKREKDRLVTDILSEQSDAFAEGLKRLAKARPPQITILRLTNDKAALASSKTTASLSQMLGWKAVADGTNFALAEENKGWVVGVYDPNNTSTGSDVRSVVVSEDGSSWDMAYEVPGTNGKVYIALPAGKNPHARASHDMLYAASERTMKKVDQDIARYDALIDSDYAVRRLWEWLHQEAGRTGVKLDS